MKKRCISLLVALVMIAATSMTAFAAGFSDVDASFSWAKEAIDTLSEEGVINGYPDGTFAPSKNITKEEAVALFAKSLGANDRENAEILNFAKDTYSQLLENYTSYAKDNAAFLIHKGILTTGEISSFLATANKGQELKRYQAAVLIAKALGADYWLSDNPDYELNFKDKNDIPSDAMPYVYYAADKGIITGMTEDTFGPLGNVTRAQVAVMIYRILDSMDFEYISGTVTKIDINTISIKNSDGDARSYKVPADVYITVNGEEAKLDDLKEGMSIVITGSNGLLYSIDAIKIIPDETIYGAYKGKQTDSKSTTVKIADIESGDVTTYTLSADAAIKYEGKSATLSSFKSGDYVTLELKKGKIAVLSGEPKTVTIEGLILEGIEFSPDVTLKLRNNDDELLTYVVKSNAKLKRNSTTVDFSELAIGDEVDLELEYGVVSSVRAFGIDKNVSGTIEEITISKKTSYITVNTGKDVAQYAIARDVEVTVDGEAATLYDLRLGDYVEFSASSSTITKITVSSAITNTEVTGVVKLVNTTYGMIVLETTNAAGDVSEAQIFVKSTAKILDASDGRVKSVKDIKTGQKIMAAGAINTGIFEASSIMILVQQ
ncbi:MAG: S-layer homology domain-containing protein [Ruminococcaceae bacterium]|nr:S-layer homology domain-containing protein [Oscillospiraceae bacterium]